MATELPMVRPFSCGTMYADWTESNCHSGCSKAAPEDGTEFTCDIERALFEAYVGDGEVTAEIARRMGLERWKGYYNWPCLERDPPWRENE